MKKAKVRIEEIHVSVQENYEEDSKAFIKSIQKGIVGLLKDQKLEIAEVVKDCIVCIKSSTTLYNIVNTNKEVNPYLYTLFVIAYYLGVSLSMLFSEDYNICSKNFIENTPKAPTKSLKAELEREMLAMESRARVQQSLRDKYNPLFKAIQKRIAAAAEEQGLNDYAISRGSGMSVSAIKRLMGKTKEEPKDVTIRVLYSVSRYLNLPLSSLVEEEPGANVEPDSTKESESYPEDLATFDEKILFIQEKVHTMRDNGENTRQMVELISAVADLLAN